MAGTAAAARALFSGANMAAIGSVALALVAHRALHPRRSLQTMFTFASSLLPSELSPQLFLACVALLWSNLRGGRAAMGHVPHEAADVARLLRWAASVGGAGVAVVAFAQMALHSLAASASFTSALRGAGVPVARRRGTLAALSLVPTAWVLSRGVRVTRDVTYAAAPEEEFGGGGEGKPLKLDVYFHARSLRPRAPCFVYIHGGGWVTGHRRYASIPLLYRLAAAGWLVFTANYRLAPRARFPAQLVDCKRAVAWVRRNAAAHGGDGGCIVVGGESAGGHLAALLALTGNAPEYQPGFEGADTAVQGWVSATHGHTRLLLFVHPLTARTRLSRAHTGVWTYMACMISRIATTCGRRGTLTSSHSCKNS